jgi:hypothetical protein
MALGNDDHEATERALLEEFLAELRWQHERNDEDWTEPRKSWLRYVVDEVLLTGQYPGTRVVVKAHYRPDPSVTTEISARVWDRASGGGWETGPGSTPSVVLANLLEWVDTEVEVGDRRAYYLRGTDT